FGDFGTTDMMLRDVNTGLFRVYNINNNQIVGNNPTGPVGVNWQFSGVGNFSGRGTSDMLLRNSDTGELRAYKHRQQSDHRLRSHRQGGRELAVFGSWQLQQRARRKRSHIAGQQRG